MLGPNQVYKINIPIEIRYVTKNNFSGLTDLVYIVTSPSQVDSSPAIMTEIQPGIYRSYFTPNEIGYWWVRVYSSSHPEFNFTNDFFVNYNYGDLELTLMKNNTTQLIDAGVLKSNLLVDNLILIDGRDISVDGANLDSHIANTNNPHNVTKTQIGLDNVTNDAQLKRAANDFNSFSIKNTPISSDIILIEDSQNSYNKKYINLGSITNEYYQNSSEGESLTTSTSYLSKVLLTFTPSLAGTFLIKWYCEVINSNAGKYTDILVYLNGTTVLGETRAEGSWTYSSGFFHNISGFSLQSLSNAATTINLMWKAVTNTAYIRRARLIATRIGE